MKIDKSLLSGSTTLLVLSLLAEGEKYGYQMIQELAAKSDNTFQMKEGTLYPILHGLERDGCVEVLERVADGRTRRYYRLTGKGRGLENARALADFFRRARPDRIVNFSLFLHRRAPLYQDVLSGQFAPTDELENLREERELLSLLETDGLAYDGFHDAIAVRVRGTLPRDREKMLRKLDEAIGEYEKKPPIFSVVA